MAFTPDKLQRRAIKAGIRAAKKEHHPLSEAELRKVKIQMVPGGLRLTVLIAGIAMILAGLIGWPVASNPAQALLGVGGVVLVIFAIVGVRRSLGKLFDAVSNDGAGALIEIVLAAIGDAVGV